ncbi:MAG: wax ester/triacylglycerol synthase family O-acyltransferase [Actinomycetales bacterium]|nr:wax ester/triacylglycerol synthase family O-acyltransferase [Actinomycetales bacterium]
MNLIDASFLYSEDGQSHNDVGVVLVFDGPAPIREDVMQLIADRIALVPRFRQKIKHVPYAMALPVWMDDTTFTMRRHVHHNPAPPAPDPLGAAVSQIMSVPMDLSIPLWETHLITGLPEDQFALVMRMHHAMVDGVDSIEIIRYLLSDKPEAEPPILDTWRARPEVPDATLIASAFTDAVKDAVNLWTQIMTKGYKAFPKMPETLDLSAFMSTSIPLNPMAINGPVRAGRAYAMTEVPFTRLRAIRKLLGSGTINDVVLSACAYGYTSVINEYLHEQVENRSIRAMVPVSLHSPDQAGVAGHNEIGAMVVELPLGTMDPLVRHERIRKQMETFKTLKNAMPADTINPGSSMASPMTLMMASRMASSAPVFVNTVISNVPGPQTTLYLDGRRMTRMGACISLWTPLKIAISVMSYDGTVTVSVVTDDASFPKVHVLLDAIQAGLDDIEAAARAAATTEAVPGS